MFAKGGKTIRWRGSDYYHWDVGLNRWSQKECKSGMARNQHKPKTNSHLESYKHGLYSKCLRRYFKIHRSTIIITMKEANNKRLLSAINHKAKSFKRGFKPNYCVNIQSERLFKLHVEN